MLARHNNENNTYLTTSFQGDAAFALVMRDVRGQFDTNFKLVKILDLVFHDLWLFRKAIEKELIA